MIIMLVSQDLEPLKLSFKEKLLNFFKGINNLLRQFFPN